MDDHELDVNWDHSRSLMLTLPPERIEILLNQDIQSTSR